MRIKCIVLKNHGYSAVFWLKIVNYFSVDLNGAAAYLLKAGDHAKSCAFAASRRTDEYHKLLVLYIQIKILDRYDVVVIYFFDFCQFNTGHSISSSFLSQPLTAPPVTPST